jgi:hypothetical protein
MSPFVKVFGCRPRQTMPQALAASNPYGSALVFRPDIILRIRRPKKLGRSGESPVPQPWSIFAEPVKVGDEWYVLARHPSGQREHVRRFKSATEAKNWIARKSTAWLKNGVTRMISRCKRIHPPRVRPPVAPWRLLVNCEEGPRDATAGLSLWLGRQTRLMLARSAVQGEVL